MSETSCRTSEQLTGLVLENRTSLNLILCENVLSK